MMERKYTCFTKQGNWYFYATSHVESLRLALYLCWRDGEDFIKVVTDRGETLGICIVEKSGLIHSL